MSEETSVVGGSNGPLAISPEMAAAAKAEFDKLSPDVQKKAIEELQAMLGAGLAAAPSVDEGAKTEPPPEASAPSTPKAEPEPAIEAEPFPDPSYMVGWGEQAYLWSEEAIEASAYLVSHAAWKKAHPHLSIDAFAYLMVGDKIKRFRPFDGFLLKEEGGGTTGQPIVFLGLAQQPMILATPAGRIFESKGPTNVVMHACFAFLKLRTLLQYKGVTHVRIRPIGYHHTLAGGREWMSQQWVEPDEANPRQPKLVSLESALGKAGR